MTVTLNDTRKKKSISLKLLDQGQAFELYGDIYIIADKSINQEGQITCASLVPVKGKIIHNIHSTNDVMLVKLAVNIDNM